MKITFMGAGSTVFAKNVLGDVLLTAALTENLTITLYDIDASRLEDSFILIERLNQKYNCGKARVEKFLGVENRKRLCAEQTSLSTQFRWADMSPARL